MLPCDKLNAQIFTFTNGPRETAPSSNQLPAARGLFSEPEGQVAKMPKCHCVFFSQTTITAVSVLSVPLVFNEFAGEAAHLQ